MCGAVLSLGQDVSEEVRASVCGVLAPVAAGLSQESIRNHLMPSLLNLCCDDKVNVKIAALHAILDLIPHVDHGKFILLAAAQEIAKKKSRKLCGTN